MNITQKRYSISRVQKMAEEKKAEISELIKDKARLADREAIKLLKCRKVSEMKSEAMTYIKSACESPHRNATRTTAGSRSVHLFTPESEKAARDHFEKKMKPYTYGKIATPITEEAQRICDEIMIGDSDTALKLIEAFSKFKSV